jgi:Flp pilus assembly protein CpaB
LLAGSLVLLTACTALFVSAYLRAGHQVEVLAVAKAVAQGAEITADDLRVARISIAGGLAPVPASAASSVIGRPAAVALLPGTLLTMAELSVAPKIAPGEAVVGVALKSGQLPAGGVFPGEQVDVVLTGPPGSTDSGPSASGLSATVLASDILVTAVEAAPPSSSSGGTVVSLLAPRDEAGVIAGASASGQVALVVVGGQ